MNNHEEKLSYDVFKSENENGPQSQVPWVTANVANDPFKYIKRLLMKNNEEKALEALPKGNPVIPETVHIAQCPKTHFK